MAEIKTGADNVGTLLLQYEKRRGVVIDSLPDPVKAAVVEKIARNLVILADMQLIALESPSPMETLQKIDSYMDQMKREIGPLQRPSSRPANKKHH